MKVDEHTDVERSSLKAVFFDAAGTLIYLPKSVGEHYREVALRHGADLPTASLDEAFRHAWKLASKHPTSDGARVDDDKGWWRSLVEQVVAATLPSTLEDHFDQEAYFEELYVHFTLPGVWAAYPDVELTLRQLQSRRLKLGVISNFDRRLYTILDQLGLAQYFDTVVISSEVGADKPDPIIFLRALALLNIEPSEAIHVGDDPKSDRGASGVGIEVFELDRPQRTLAEFPAWLDGRESRQNTLATGHDLP